MNKVIIPTDGRAFAIFIGAKPKPRYGVGRRFAEMIGAKPKTTPPDLGKKFAESIRDKK